MDLGGPIRFPVQFDGDSVNTSGSRNQYQLYFDQSSKKLVAVISGSSYEVNVTAL